MVGPLCLGTIRGMKVPSRAASTNGKGTCAQGETAMVDVERGSRGGGGARKECIPWAMESMRHEEKLRIVIEGISTGCRRMTPDGDVGGLRSGAHRSDYNYGHCRKPFGRGAAPPPCSRSPQPASATPSPRSQMGDANAATHLVHTLLVPCEVTGQDWPRVKTSGWEEKGNRRCYECSKRVSGCKPRRIE